MADVWRRGLITVILRSTEENNGTQYCYQILDHLLVSNVELPILAPYAANSSPTTESLLNLSNVQHLGLSSKPEVAEGWLLSKKLTLAIQRASNGMRIAYPGVANYDVHFNHQLIVVRPQAGATTEQVILGLIGPAMIALLAEQGIWVFHTSAVQLDNRVICFCGQSGSGKSTLAAKLQQIMPGVTRLADDLLAVTMVDNRIVCLPRYTQPRLALDQQYQDSASQLVLTDLFVLTHSKGKSILPLNQQTPGLIFSLIKQFMGTTLFSPVIKKQQLDFCSQLIKAGSITALAYPHNQQVFGQVADLIKLDRR